MEELEDVEEWEQEVEEERDEEERMVDECENDWDDWGPDLHGGLGLALCMHTEKLTWTLMTTDAGSRKMRRWVSFICYSKFIRYLGKLKKKKKTF